LDLENVSHKGIAKLHTAGVKDFPDFYKLTDAQLTKAGFGNRKDAIRSAFAKTLQGAKISKIMALSGVFSDPDFALGETRISSILRTIPFADLKAMSKPVDMAKKVLAIPGIGERGAQLFVTRLPRWWLFWAKISPNWKPPKQIGTSFKGEVVCFSGFRNSGWAKTVELNGGTYKDNLTRETTLLVTDSATSTKAAKATELGIKVMTPGAFSKKYNLAS
jgi:NAD-dependent DNA ligase